MSIKLDTSKDEIVGVVRQTKDYKKFKFLQHNRKVRTNSSRFKALLKSLEEYGQVVPILVDDSGYVIEGQHRLTGCQMLGIPVIYVIVEGKNYSVKQIQEAQKAMAWNTEDHIEILIKQGNENYKTLLKLHDKYKFGYSIMAAALMDVRFCPRRKLEDGGLVITPENKTKAIDFFEKLAEVQEAINGRMNEKISTAIWVFSKLEDYDHDKMVKKLKHFYDMLAKYNRTLDKVNMWEMATILEDCYNFKESQKVSLANRYSFKK